MNLNVVEEKSTDELSLIFVKSKENFRVLIPFNFILLNIIFYFVCENQNLELVGHSATVILILSNDTILLLSIQQDIFIKVWS